MMKFDEAIKTLQNDRETHLQRIDFLQSENERIRSEKYKDAELFRMRQEVGSLQNAMRFGFPITAEEHAAIEKWKDAHVQSRHKGKRRPLFSYSFVPTSLGVIGTCRCRICYESAIERYYTLTHYEDYSLSEKMRIKNEVIEEADANFVFSE